MPKRALVLAKRAYGKKRADGAKRTWWFGFAETSLPGFFNARMATPA
jgi:hypothetical protein